MNWWEVKEKATLAGAMSKQARDLAIETTQRAEALDALPEQTPEIALESSQLWSWADHLLEEADLLAAEDPETVENALSGRLHHLTTLDEEELSGTHEAIEGYLHVEEEDLDIPF